MSLQYPAVIMKCNENAVMEAVQQDGINSQVGTDFDVSVPCRDHEVQRERRHGGRSAA